MIITIELYIRATLIFRLECIMLGAIVLTEKLTWVCIICRLKREGLKLLATMIRQLEIEGCS
jgi:hypothetical protein